MLSLIDMNYGLQSKKDSVSIKLSRVANIRTALRFLFLFWNAKDSAEHGVVESEDGVTQLKRSCKKDMGAVRTNRAEPSNVVGQTALHRYSGIAGKSIPQRNTTESMLSAAMVWRIYLPKLYERDLKS